MSYLRSYPLQHLDKKLLAEIAEELVLQERRSRPLSYVQNALKSGALVFDTGGFPCCGRVPHSFSVLFDYQKHILIGCLRESYALLILGGCPMVSTHGELVYAGFEEHRVRVLESSKRTR